MYFIWKIQIFIVRSQTMELNIDFFKIKNTKIARQGRILISEPFLSDTYFKRSVVLLTEHSEEGSVGFVLNKPVDLSIQDVIEDFPHIDTTISIGGPVNTNTVHYLHTMGDSIPNSVKVMDNLHWGGDFDLIKDMISLGKIKPGQIRFFLGYAGWSANQLNDELTENAWLIAEMDSRTIMRSFHAELWKETLHRLGERYKVWTNFPENPGLN